MGINRLSMMIWIAENCWNDSVDVPWCNGNVFRPEMRLDYDCWRKTVDYAAKNGCDSIFINLSNGIKYKTHPEIAVKNAWEVDFLKSELDYLRSIGLTPYPMLNFSAAHDAWLGEYSRMVSTHKYYEVAKDLIHEIIEIFDTPEFFSLEYDEENGLNQKRLHYACYRQFDLVWHDVNYLCDCIREKGVRPSMCADYYWSYPEEFLRNVPKDVALTNWYYDTLYFDNANPRPTDYWSENRLKSFKALTEAGYDIFLCGAGTNSFNFEQFIKLAKETLDESKILGFQICGSWEAPVPETVNYNLDAINQAKYAVDKYFGGN